MAGKSRECPKCRVEMEFRLGEFNCPGCGHNEPDKAPRKTAQFSGPGFRKERSSGPASQAPPPGVRPVRFAKDSDTDQVSIEALSREKVTFLTVFFAFELGSSIVIATSYAGPTAGLLSLPNALISAVFATICVGFVLYFDNDCVRQCCMWSLAPLVLFALWGIILAIGQGQGLITVSIIPTVLLSGWLVSILARDRRSE